MPLFYNSYFTTEWDSCLILLRSYSGFIITINLRPALKYWKGMILFAYIKLIKSVSNNQKFLLPESSLIWPMKHLFYYICAIIMAVDRRFSRQRYLCASECLPTIFRGRVWYALARVTDPLCIKVALLKSNTPTFPPGSSMHFSAVPPVTSLRANLFHS